MQDVGHPEKQISWGDVNDHREAPSGQKIRAGKRDYDEGADRGLKDHEERQHD